MAVETETARVGSFEASTSFRARPILIAEDDRDSRREMAELFRSSGFEVRVAGSGRGAVTKVGKYTSPVAIMDMDMPGELDGAEAAIKIYQQDTDVVVVSAKRGKGDYEQRLAEAHVPYVWVEKPLIRPKREWLIKEVDTRYRRRLLFEALSQESERSYFLVYGILKSMICREPWLEREQIVKIVSDLLAKEVFELEEPLDQLILSLEVDSVYSELGLLCRQGKAGTVEFGNAKEVLRCLQVKQAKALRLEFEKSQLLPLGEASSLLKELRSLLQNA